MYYYDSNFDFRFTNLIVAVGGETDSKILKVFMDTMVQEELLSDLSNISSIRVDHMNMIL